MKTTIIFLAFTLICATNLFSRATVNIIDDALFRAELTFSGDIDGDGDNDVIATSNADPKVVWYENLDGLGNFSSEILITAQEVGVTAVEIVDLDGDNDLDLVISSNSGGRIAWYENLDGQATFSAPNLIVTGLSAPIDMVTNDLNNDGYMDVIVSSKPQNKISWFENLDGNGTFASENIAVPYAPEPDRVECADVDGDNQIDLISISQSDRKIVWFKNLDGMGDFSVYHVINSEIHFDEMGFSIGDIDNDGDIDVISTSYQQSRLSWYENLTGQGDFAPRINISWNLRDVRAIHLTDLDNDGNLDIVYSKYRTYTDYYDQIGWFKNLGGGTGSFASEEVLLEDGQSKFINSGDLNGDNQSDIIATFREEDTLFWLDSSAALNVESQELFNVSIHPNPSSDVVNVQTDKIISKLDVFNVRGQLLLSAIAQKSIDISSLNSGLYLMRIWDNQGNYQLEKIIKE